MFDHLDIYAPRDRWLVGLADAGLAVASAPARLLRRPARRRPRRILLLRLERIGDLLMSLGAIRAVRALAPDAEIDLAVGRWNEPIARLLPEVTRLEIVDAGWLARGAPGGTAPALARRFAGWRTRGYDLAINFEGDIRSHALLALTGARRRVGFAHAGGGPLLTDVVAHDGSGHVADNAIALVERAFDRPAGTLPRAGTPDGAAGWRLQVPEAARAAARAAVAQLAGSPAVLDTPWLAVHAAGGRAIKQWPTARFAEAAAALARTAGATVVLTGGPDDAAAVDDVERRLGAAGLRPLRVQGLADLVLLAALLERSRLLLTGDTGPMHLAAAVGTPVLAVFGPSMPWRYAPLVAPHRIVRVDLPCSPCNRIRLPPARCQGHTPDCLEQVTAAAVVDAGRALLASLDAPMTAGAR
jgi:ADP-heptose:LPS heptosyltransferase